MWGSRLEVQYACFNEFPDQCAGCPEYSETRQDQATQLTLLAGMGMMNPVPYMPKKSSKNASGITSAKLNI